MRNVLIEGGEFPSGRNDVEESETATERPCRALWTLYKSPARTQPSYSAQGSSSPSGGRWEHLGMQGDLLESMYLLRGS